MAKVFACWVQQVCDLKLEWGLFYMKATAAPAQLRYNFCLGCAGGDADVSLDLACFQRLPAHRWMDTVSRSWPQLTDEEAAGAFTAPIQPAGLASVPFLQGGVKFALEEAPSRLSFLVGLGRLAPCLKQVNTANQCAGSRLTVRDAMSLSSVPGTMPQAGSPQHRLQGVAAGSCASIRFGPGSCLLQLWASEAISDAPHLAGSLRGGGHLCGAGSRALLGGGEACRRGPRVGPAGCIPDRYASAQHQGAAPKERHER